MAVAVAAAACGAAFAQQSPDGTADGAPQTIQVTAQKRLQLMQDVPMSVSALTADDLRQRGIDSIEKLGGATPALVVNEYGTPVITVITLRGVQQFDFGDHQESPVAVFVDGSYVPYLSAVGMNLFDVSRVEVLRGPQGTLFGRNATGGVIQLVSARPTATPTGYGELQLGRFGSRRAEGALSGPVGGGWLGRVSLLVDRRDGLYRNLIGPDKGDADNRSWRLQAARPLGERGDFNLTLRGSRDRTSTSPYVPLAAFPDANTGLVRSDDRAAFASFCSAVFGTTVQPDAQDCLSGDAATGSPYRIRHDRNGRFTRDHHGATATLNLHLADATLTAITSWGRLRKAYDNEDSDGTSIDAVYFGQSVKATDLAQEIRLAGAGERLEWVAGAYALRIDGRYGGDVGFFPGDPALAARVQNAYTLKTQTAAVFGQTEYQLAPAWKLVSGLRWTEDDKRFRMSTPCTGPGCDPFGFTDPAIVQGSGFDDSVAGARTHRRSGNWDGKLQLNWAPDRDTLVYGGVARGTKAGGYNGGATAFYPVERAVFDDEVLMSTELGYKQTSRDRRTSFSISAYHYAYRGVQVFNQNGISTLTFNVDGRVKGIDAELQSRFGDGWDVQLGASLLRTRVDPVENFDPISGIRDVRAQELPNSPHWSLNAGLRRQLPLAEGRLTLVADVRARASHKLNLIDHPATREPAYATLGLAATYAPAHGGWELGAWCRNVTNETYRVVATPFVSTSGSVIQIFGEPRTCGASMRQSF
jgi:iron complex outermembrane receptor protein